MKKFKAVAICLGDTTYISRFHRSCETLIELGLELEAYSVNPRSEPEADLPDYSRLVEGKLRGLRGRILAPLRQLELVLRFIFLAYRSNPYLVVAHNLPALVVACVVKRLRRNKVRVLVYDAMELEIGRAEHTPSFIPFDRHARWKGKLERFLATRADLVISADYARTELMQDDIGRNDILTCRNVPRLKEIPTSNLVRETLGLADKTFVILYQGLIAEGRGLETMINCLAGLPKNIVFVIMGFGKASYLEEIKAAASENCVISRVFFLPPVSNMKLLHWTASADVVHSLIENTCLSYFTAAPNKLYEAAMAGVPVIASDFPEVRSVLTKHSYGILIDPESCEDIRAAVIDLYGSPVIRDNYRNAGLRAARSELNWEIESRKLKARIMEIL